MGRTKKFSLETASGCKFWIAVLLVAILLTSFFAALLSSDGGKVKIETIRIDSRGAVLVGDLYYPAGTSDKDNLPVIIVAHGAGVSKNNYRGFSEELSRRGFVVLNVNGYGTGLSEFPRYDENGMGEDGYNSWTTPSGILDAVNFVRTLNFIDKTRIGIAGHSQGSRRAGYSAVLDCGYYTFNDIMINELSETFQQSFTEAEINQNADQLAAKRLNKDELDYYNALKAQRLEDYNTMIKAVCIIGGVGSNCAPTQKVKVAGHEVVRNCQVNEAFIGGYFDGGIAALPKADTTKQYWHTDSDIALHTWYVIDDANAKSSTLGNIYDVSIVNNTALQHAITNRSTRYIALNKETHSKNFFSNQTAREVVKYFEQVFAFNRGELSDPATKPLDASNIRFIWREIFNCLAMLSMIALLIPVAALLYKTKFFERCNGKNEIFVAEFEIKRFWIVNAIAAVGSFLAIYYINTLFAPGLPAPKFWPLFPSFWLTPIFLIVLSIVAIIEIIVLNYLDKKKLGKSLLGGINVNLGLINILKTILASFIILGIAYLTLVLIGYLFNQDYRLWMMAFEEMKVEQWRYVWRFAILLFPFYVITGIATNYSSTKKLPEWLDILVAVVVNSIGVWILGTITTVVLHSSGVSISNWTSSYGFLIFVPVTVFITKKMYRVTKSVWLGASVNSLLIGWMMVCTIGYNSYVAQNWISNFFNI